MVTRQPADSIIVFATSAGDVASDGQGRNGLFTSQLLPHLANPGIEINEVFRRTGADVSRASGGRQVPAIYSQFFGIAFLGEEPEGFDRQAAMSGTSPIVIFRDGIFVQESDPTRFHSVGFSLGTSLAAPWLSGTVHGSFSPLSYTFIQLGFDFGMFSGAGDVMGYYSLFPFAHLGVFLPVNNFGFFAGIGGGFWYYSYSFQGLDPYTNYLFAASLSAGISFLDMINLSYALRTNFKGFSHKISVGYIYRFK